MDRYRQMIRDVIASLAGRANLASSHVTPKDILTYRDSIIAANKTARTANPSVKVVSAAPNAAVRQHITESNPTTALESLPVNGEEKGTFTPTQVAKLVCAAGGDWRRAILAGYYTGARISGVANMRWDAIVLMSKYALSPPHVVRNLLAFPPRRGEGLSYASQIESWTDGAKAFFFKTHALDQKNLRVTQKPRVYSKNRRITKKLHFARFSFSL